MNDIQQAREWADDMRRVESECGGVRQDALVAAELIQSLPDQWVDAEKVRGLIMPYIGSETAGPALWYLAKDLEALLPPPSPRTLADMTPEEREACQWMQAKVFSTASALGIITGVDEYAHSAIILFADGMAKNVPWGHITPLPGPKLEWPSLSVSDKSEPVSVETEDVTEESRTALPRPEDVPAGEPWIVRYEREEWVGVRANENKVPWHIISMDGLDCRDVEDSEISLMPRLEWPEVKP